MWINSVPKDSFSSLFCNLTEGKTKITGPLRSKAKTKQKKQAHFSCKTNEKFPHCSWQSCKISVQKNASFTWISLSPVPALVIPVAATLQPVLLVDPVPACGSAALSKPRNLVTLVFETDYEISLVFVGLQNLNTSEVTSRAQGHWLQALPCAAPSAGRPRAQAANRNT